MLRVWDVAVSQIAWQSSSQPCLPVFWEHNKPVAKLLLWLLRTCCVAAEGC